MNNILYYIFEYIISRIVIVQKKKIKKLRVIVCIDDRFTCDAWYQNQR